MKIYTHKDLIMRQLHISSMMQLLLLSVFNIFFSVSVLIAQNTNNPPLPPKIKAHKQKPKVQADEQLARQYYFNKEYEKALPYYQKLSEKYPKREYFTIQYINCLDALQKPEQAIEILKKKIKRKKTYHIKYQVVLAYLYGKENNPKQQKKHIQIAQKLAIDNPVQIQIVANEFLMRRMPEAAADLYLSAYRKIKDVKYLLNLGDVHKTYGNWTEMIVQYLAFLDENPSGIQTIKNKLQSVLSKDKEGDISGQLKKILIRRVQEHPRKTYFSDLLLWFSIQQKDFEMAFVQSRALDKRLKENGDRMLQLADICIENKDYLTAIKACDYVLKKGKTGTYYFDALSTKINANYRKITETPDYSQADVLSLETELEKALDDFGKNANTIYLIRILAHIRTFYLHKENEAIEQLIQAIHFQGLNKNEQAQLKLELADEYLYTGEVWESTLLYSQIEKALPQSPVASEAKFRNAKLSFYIGEFGWAKTQLLPLKASTSKRIANDALSLSILIDENMKEDTSFRSLKLYAKASYLLFRHKPKEAITTLDSIIKGYSFHSILDDALLQKAKIQLQINEYEAAQNTLEKLIQDYAYEVTADDALWLLANIYEKQEKEKAMNIYFRIIKEHPNSIYAAEARDKYRFLRGDDMQENE
jgi:tetratricopeptide (TPR) repeat protein